MKKYIFILIFLTGCSTDPATGRNGLEEWVYRRQCINGICPPAENASYQEKLEYAKLKQAEDLNDTLAAENRRKIETPRSFDCMRMGPDMIHCN